MNIGFIKKVINIDLIKYASRFFAVSLVLILISVIFISYKGLNLGVDFKGGLVVDLKAPKDYSIDFVKGEIQALGVLDFSIKQFGSNEIQIIISNSAVENPSDLSQLLDEMQVIFTKNNFIYMQSSFVGPSISKDLIKGGSLAVILSLIGIYIYVWIRFDWQYGIISIITLSHDVLISLLMLSIFQYEFNVASIAAILTIIGYSINDTVVVFDQVRENVRKHITQDVRTILNHSLSQVFSRSLATSITVVLVLGSIYLFGGSSLESFSFTLLVGIIFGTYSSICLATPMLFYIGDIKSRVLKEKREQKI